MITATRRPLRDIDCTNPINWESPLARGLVGFWIAIPGLTMDQPRWLDMVDLSQGYHGTLTNGPTWSKDAPPGSWGSLIFDGTNDRVTATAPLLNAVANVSVAAWLRPTATKTALVFGKGLSTNPPFVEYSITIRSGGEGRFTVNNGSLQTLDSISTYSTDEWIHCVGTWDGATMRIYLNGVEDNSSSVSGSITLTDANLQIGGDQVFVEYFAGQIDGVMVWPGRTLSASSILNLYRDSVQGFPKLLRRIPQPRGFVAAAGGVAKGTVFSSPVFGGTVIT